MDIGHKYMTRKLTITYILPAFLPDKAQNARLFLNAIVVVITETLKKSSNFGMIDIIDNSKFIIRKAPSSDAASTAKFPALIKEIEIRELIDISVVTPDYDGVLTSNQVYDLTINQVINEP
jgi:hypothetical protein